MAGFRVQGTTMKTSGGFAVRGRQERRQEQAVEDVVAAVEEVGAIVERTDFQKRADREDQRFQDATDPEFTLVPTVLLEADGVTAEVPVYPALVFATRDAKEQFLRGMEERFPGEILGDKYISGELLARALGFEFDVRVPTLQKVKRADKKLMTLR